MEADMSLLVLIEHDRGAMASASAEALTFGRGLAADLGVPLHALTMGAAADVLVAELGAYGVQAVHQAHHDLLADYGPETWGETVAAVVRTQAPIAVVATGTDRGNEVLAQAAARLDAAFVANALEVTSTAGPWEIKRVRWGGSLMERTQLDGACKFITVSSHAVAPELAADAAQPEIISSTVTLDAVLGRSVVRERVERAAGVTLATAPVVVSGGRGVGSSEGFSILEELAGILGGVVGCSRAVTNNGWRPHTDQVGQTGTRIAPELYIACGISGAIQHWVGAMASKRILAINTDREANMVSKADYAVIGDLHKIVPAITAEIQRRRS
jgi:electron transfer flavoprotein alpha subunit